MSVLSRFSRRTWIILCLIIIAGGLLFFFLRGEKVRPAYISPPLFPRNYGGVVEVDSKLRFFNGRAFVDYDTEHGTTSTQLHNLTYPPVKDVQWNEIGTKALVTSIFHSPDDTFGRRLRASRQPLGAQRHWVVDIAAGTLTLIPAHIERVQWSGAGILGSAQEGGEETIEKTNLFIIDAQTGSTKPIASIQNLRRVLPTNTSDVYVLRSERDEYVVSRVSMESGSQDLYRGPNDTAVVNSDGKYIAVIDALAVEDESTAVPLATVRLIEAGSGKELKKMEGYSLDALVEFVSPEQLVIIDMAREHRIARYDIAADDMESYTPAKGQPPLGFALGVKNFGDDFIVSTTSSLQVISFDPLAVHIPTLNYNQSSLSGDGFLVVKKESGVLIQSLTVNIYQPPVARRYRAALELIRQQGLNPDLFDVTTDTSYLSN